MRLISDDGASIDLSIVGYQFPSAPAGRRRGDIEDWDANWLVIRGAVHTADGHQWGFSEPCLTTGEAASLQRFLQQVAEAEESVVAEQGERTPKLAFTEPELSHAALDVDSESDPRIVEVHLSHGAAPPPGSRQPEVDGTTVTIRMSVSAWRLAAHAWSTELADHPQR